ncbi:hypothetical protein EJ05DRAFT_511186 [Pseudovirgaria hyperparasitica]|uniref:Heterokaryon incompatibility domain-containing protein n=1 Tax=Pseudovirgaria hyperparasitica TaxID=470096 RepID=A0A6A6W722_9PEZI|nr:uncharacterized protein EJ05DRAFT_511186 [Pseudovirgaria hyperparasitica]KAF2757367.1 hypothetical protein EJ05DRAFT_511186 [Pseudovirgaria hyperparasitica]
MPLPQITAPTKGDITETHEHHLESWFAQIADYRKSVRSSIDSQAASYAQPESVHTKEGPYTYQPLNQHVDEIRLVRILPNIDRSRPLQCEIHHRPLQSSEHFALSYCWGKGPPTNAIILDGHRFSVSDNLYSAMLELRHPEQAINVWIDAICMNQDDLEERSREVLRMRSIYAAAQLVVIWLGQEEFDTKRAFDHLKALSKRHRYIKSMPPVTWTSLAIRMARLPLTLAYASCHVAAESPLAAGFALYYTFSLLTEASSNWTGTRIFQWLVRLGSIVALYKILRRWITTTLAEDDRIPKVDVSINDIAALRDFFECAWFDRTWIIQELAVARRARFVRGTQGIDSESITSACAEIRRNIANSRDSPYMHTKYQRFTHLGRFQDIRHHEHGPIFQRWGRYQQSLLYLLSAFSPMDSTDPRDKVYGLLGLSQEDRPGTPNPTRVVPDYTRPVVDIYTDVARSLIQRTHTLDILSACLGSGSVSGLPSWVPDWTAPIHRPIHVLNQNSPPYTIPLHTPPYSFPSPTRLLVQGFVLGTISKEHTALRALQLPSPYTPHLPPITTLTTNTLFFLLLHYTSRLLPYIALLPGLTSLLRRAATAATPLGLAHLFTFASDVHASLLDSGTEYIFPKSWAALQATYTAPLHPHHTLVSRGFAVDVASGLSVVPGLCTSYAADVSAGDLLVMLLGAKQPCIVREVEMGSDAGGGDWGRCYVFVGPAECGGFWMHAVAWRKVREAFALGRIRVLDFELC